MLSFNFAKRNISDLFIFSPLICKHNSISFLKFDFSKFFKKYDKFKIKLLLEIERIQIESII